jgi:hypothetical protein
MNGMSENIFSNPFAGEDKGSQKSFADMMDFGSSVPGLPSMQKDGEPTAAEMEEAAEAVRYSKVVKVQDIKVETFDMSNPGHVKRYREIYKELYGLASESKILITVNERQFINCVTNPRWVLHLEWIVYDMQKKDHMMSSGD